jgi:TorA maturation chaperone TorD
MVLEEWLAERRAIAGLLAGLYRGDLANGITGLRTLLPFWQGSPCESAGWYPALAELAEELDFGQTEERLAEISDDYRRLFGGPGQLLAPPWESVYRTKEKLLFGEPEAAVRRFYRSFGMAVTVDTEAADHVAMEFAFLGRLSALAMDAPERLFDILTAQRDFLSEHLLQWLPAWSADVSRHAKCVVWRCLAVLTVGWLENDLAETERARCHLSKGLDTNMA